MSKLVRRSSQNEGGSDAFVMVDSCGQAVSATATDSHIVFSSNDGVFALTREQLETLLEWAE